MKKAGELSNKMPELKTEEEIYWRENGAGETFKLLCTLLKGNAIPTKALNLWCNKYGGRNENMYCKGKKRCLKQRK